MSDIAATTGHEPSVIDAVEAGRHDIDLHALADLVEGYGPPTVTGAGQMAEVIVDVESVSVSLGTRQQPVADLPAADRVLGFYLDFLYVERGLELGTSVSIRDVDLSVVRNALALRSDAVVGRIERLEDTSDDPTDRTNLVLLAGLLCAIAAFAVGGSDAPPAGSGGVPEAIPSVAVVENAPIAVPGEVVVDIGTAVSITRAPDEISTDTQLPSEAANISVEIGTAVVLER